MDRGRKEIGSMSGEVYRLTSQIPRGMVSTYGAIAVALRGRNSSRAVGLILHINPHAPQIPCHRVVYSDGRLGGYAKGVEEKVRLLEEEGIAVRDGRIVDLGKHLFTEFRN